MAGKEAIYSKSHLSFNAPDEYVDAILDAGINLISTANNHTYDRGYDGLERTIRVLEQKGLPYIGTSLPGQLRSGSVLLG